ncbi:uncharacterized protein (UPF0335 family) [Celeribacter halophilus]|uniref:Uncharacterized conserved protein, UPF0335 family n=2 Tax=Celeribacter halophilus TaxID=576117 RepID=A0A1I3XBE8_9RHOB|nr:uncharacterized protein (UPF0335 family) [Celeribacter halophilus]SFK16747.1 Uncharacterized conserved protein, UPF0335 family [Celeribacter halophilus]
MSDAANVIPMMDAINPQYARAVALVVKEQKASTSFIQRHLGIGYNAASRLIEAMEDEGIVTSSDHVGHREVVAQEVPADIASAAAAIGSDGKIPMKETDADREVRDNTYRVTADELRSFVERFETLEVEKKEIADQQKEVMAEAKGRGFDTKALRKLIALRKKSADEIAEEEAILDMYKEAMGMR